MRFLVLIFLIVAGLPMLGMAQSATDTLPVLKYGTPLDYEIGGIKVTGAEFSDDNAIISIAGFKVGDKIRIPGADVQKAIKNLWRLRLFTDVQIIKEKTIGEIVFLEIVVQERPRLSRYSYKGVKKGFHDDLNDEVNKFLLKGGIVTENVKVNASEAVEDFFIGKGFIDARCAVKEYPDSSRANAVRLEFSVDRGEKVKIKEIRFVGNDNLKDKKLKKKLGETKEKKRLFASSKFIKSDYDTDKESIIQYYNTLGFRDARITSDSSFRDKDGFLNPRNQH